MKKKHERPQKHKAMGEFFMGQETRALVVKTTPAPADATPPAGLADLPCVPRLHKSQLEVREEPITGRLGVRVPKGGGLLPHESE